MRTLSFSLFSLVILGGILLVLVLLTHAASQPLIQLLADGVIPVH